MDSFGKTLVLALLFIHLFPGSSGAAVWKSPDGVISVEIPNPDKYVELKPEPKALVNWESTDGIFRFAIGEKETTPKANMILGVLEQVFVRELNLNLTNGKLIESMTRQHE